MSKNSQTATLRITEKRFLSDLEKEILLDCIMRKNAIAISISSKETEHLDAELSINIISNLDEDFQNCPVWLHPNRHFLSAMEGLSHGPN